MYLSEDSFLVLALVVFISNMPRLRLRWTSGFVLNFREMNDQLPAEPIIRHKIYEVRNYSIMLDQDLATLYDVQTKALNQAVKRNPSRFPSDFMLQLTNGEWEILKSQSVTSSWGGRRTLPFAFTEHGVAMLSAVLKSERAIAVNIHIIRVFSKMRALLDERNEILLKLERVESTSKNNQADVKLIFRDLRELLSPPNDPRERIGY